jgi:hypothetical protein
MLGIVDWQLLHWLRPIYVIGGCRVNPGEVPMNSRVKSRVLAAASGIASLLISGGAGASIGGR